MSPDEQTRQVPEHSNVIEPLHPTPAPDPLIVAGIGASAGGIRALQTFFEALPPHPGITFVVVMHLSPTHESLLPEVLRARTPLQVVQVRERTRMEAEHVYVISPDQDLRISDGHIIVSELERLRGQRAPIDLLFRTLAEVHPDSIGILFSGAGTDGTIGMKTIKEHGGLLMVQLPQEAEYDTMPRSAIATGLVDFVLPAAELASKLVELRQHYQVTRQWRPPTVLPDAEQNVLQQILELIQAHTGHDFSGYKHATVLRRIERRMRIAQATSLSAYLAYLRGHPPEVEAMLKDLLISVTAFFRDAAAFETLRQEVIPQLFEGKAPEEAVRVWVPGCATGEEAYSIAILLSEYLEAEGRQTEIQLFASDPDENALTSAREGLYPEAIAADVSEARLQRFFVREGIYFKVRKALRDRIIFAQHSILKDPPFSRLDLISCRNFLIYLRRDMQEKVCELFHYALQPRGVLFLGSAESIDGLTDLFHILHKTHRIYQRALLSSSGPTRLA